MNKVIIHLCDLLKRIPGDDTVVICSLCYKLFEQIKIRKNKEAYNDKNKR